MSDQEHGTELHGRTKTVTIIINGRPVEYDKEEISFREVISLSSLPSGPDYAYTVTYRRGHGGYGEHSLVEGQSIRVKEGMIFNATATNKS